jgi:hypothetical protein
MLVRHVRHRKALYSTGSHRKQSGCNDYNTGVDFILAKKKGHESLQMRESASKRYYLTRLHSKNLNLDDHY